MVSDALRNQDVCRVASVFKSLFSQCPFKMAMNFSTLYSASFHAKEKNELIHHMRYASIGLLIIAPSIAFPLTTYRHRATIN